MANTRRVSVLGVPDSAGAYCVGVERAPAALRAAGLVARLEAAGVEVHDAGDLTERRWRPDRVRPRVQNLDDEVAAVRETADAVADRLGPDARVLVLGGSCVVALGLCGAFVRRGERPRLVYLDRHLDLNTPESTEEGSLSWMGMAHALGVDGAAPELVGAFGDSPLLRPEDVVHLGVELEQTTAFEREQVEALGVAVVPQQRLVDAPADAATEALGHLGAGPFTVHVDVDVLDFMDAPLAENVNGRNRGPTVEQLGLALAALLRRPDCRGLSIGQLDPAHAESDPDALSRFVDVVVAALTTS
ncbi:arginase family protein [Nocardioides marinquilinus]|uniref:Arginase family protein n=1 Tax=Nocardioides marinquilinus TaxID=1210400 RepID=A0ABP9PX15_9ACTN